MLIGELAGRAGTSTRTLRYYEAHGLVRGTAL
jgi:DNA-binding transcriptional MerR regulator